MAEVRGTLLSFSDVKFPQAIGRFGQRQFQENGSYPR